MGKLKQSLNYLFLICSLFYQIRPTSSLFRFFLFSLLSLIVVTLTCLKKKEVFLLTLFLMTLIQLTFTYNQLKLDLPLESHKIVKVGGVLLQDSTFSSNENSLYLVKLNCVEDVWSNIFSAKGQLLLISSTKIQLLKNSEVVAYGKLSDNNEFFNVKSIEYSISTKELLRANLFNSLANRLEEFPLSQALFLGYKANLKELDEKTTLSGSSHVLALSGMHLGVLSSFLTLLSGKKRRKLVIATLLFYLFIVGFKSSLIRAFILFLFLPLNKKEPIINLLTYTYICQVFLFPSSIFSLATLLSYTALIALIALSLPINNYLTPLFPRSLSKPFSASLAVILVLSPLTLFYFGSWYPVALILALVIIPLVTLIFMTTLLFLIFQLQFVKLILQKLTNCYEILVAKGSLFTLKYSQFCTFKSYALFTALLLTASLVIRYLYHTLNQRNRKKYDLAFRLQFPWCNQRAVRTKQPRVK
jgi:ComEC/Rec2-related protein